LTFYGLGQSLGKGQKSFSTCSSFGPFYSFSTFKSVSRAEKRACDFADAGELTEMVQYLVCSASPDIYGVLHDANIVEEFATLLR
jgi:hypothetical protein